MTSPVCLILALSPDTERFRVNESVWLNIFGIISVSSVPPGAFVGDFSNKIPFS